MTILSEAIHQRCFDDGECWIWRGSANDGTPMFKFESRTTPVRRAILLTAGVDMTGRVAAVNCGTPLCVNPAHVVAIPRRKFYRSSRIYRFNVAQKIRLAQIHRARSHITAEIADAIRTSTARGIDLARQYGISQSQVSYIRRGLRWGDLSGWLQLTVRTKK